VLLRLVYLSVANVFTLLRLPPKSNRDKDAEILALRHQLSVLQITDVAFVFHLERRATRGYQLLLARVCWPTECLRTIMLPAAAAASAAITPRYTRAVWCRP